MSMSRLSPLRVGADSRHLVTAEGEPFFWLGDTAWSLLHRATVEEAALYLDCRARQGFTLTQVVALAEHDGLATPNAYGRFPLLRNAAGEWDPTLPDEVPDDTGDSYWSHVDRILDMAAERGLYVGLLPTWGDKFNRMWGVGPEIFTPENARAYGLWLGTRYRDASHLVWILGGDRPLSEHVHLEIIRAMAKGLKEGDGGRHLMTFHPAGESSSSDMVHDEPWLDFNMIQSGHAKRHLENDHYILADRAKTPIKPTLDGEPRYEDHPVGFKPENGYLDASDVREALWWGVLSGGLGVTYGHHAVWGMNRERSPYFPLTWREGLTRPAAEQVRHLKALMLRHPFMALEPDLDGVQQPGTGAARILGARGSDFAYYYTAAGLAVTVQCGVLPGDSLAVAWFNPRTGARTEVGQYPNQGVRTFSPETSGRGEDWVLVLESVG